MRVAILSSPPDLSAYVAEIFKTWGLALFDVVEPDAVADLDPSSTSVAVCPTSESVGRCEDALVSYAR